MSISFFRLDSVHKWDECEHPSAGRHSVWEDRQHQLGGCVQVPHFHTPSDGLRQWGQHVEIPQRMFNYLIKVSHLHFNKSVCMVYNTCLYFIAWKPHLMFFCRDSYSIWPQETHFSISAISWTKVACKVCYNTVYTLSHGICHDTLITLFFPLQRRLWYVDVHKEV